MTNTQKRGRLVLLTISFMFFAPMFLAMYLYFSDNAWRPAESTQHGQLVSPPVGLPDIPLDAEAARFREVWTLLVVADGQCDPLCLQTLEHVRQIRLSLGPKMTRLQNVFLPLVPAASEQLDRAAFPKLIVTGPETSILIQDLIGNWVNGQIFLVDPFGNLMMSYPPGTDMGDVRKDLGHLLKISTIG
jgi:hypothetical protein